MSSTAIFYPVNNSPWIFRGVFNPQKLWVDAHSTEGIKGISATITGGASQYMIRLGVQTTPNYYYTFNRTGIIFNITGLPHNAVAQSAQLYFTGVIKTNGWAAASFGISLYPWYPDTYTNLTASTNFSTLGVPTASLATPILYTNFATGSTSPRPYNILSLNSAGLSYVSTSGYTAFGLRESTYDGPNIPPTWEAATGGSEKVMYYLTFDMMATANPVKLVIVWDIVPNNNYASGTLVNGLKISKNKAAHYKRESRLETIN